MFSRATNLVEEVLCVGLYWILGRFPLTAWTGAAGRLNRVAQRVVRPPTSLRREEQAPPVLTHFCRPPKQSSIFSILKIVAVISKIQRLCTKLNSCWASLQSPQATPVKL